MKTIITLFVCSLFFSSLTYAQPGTLDRSFGDTGIVIGEGFTGSFDAAALQKDGKILIGGHGTVLSTGTVGFLLVRYNTDGSIDNSFGKEGIAPIGYLAGTENAIVSIMIMPDSKIMAVGQIDLDIAIMRYLADGRPDSSFGTNGVVRSNLGLREFPTSAALQPDGKIVVAGNTQAELYDDFQPFVARYMPDGSLDESFGDHGKVFEIYDGDAVNASDVLLLPDGKIVMGGTYFDYEQQIFFLNRYLPDGSKDLAFGKQGMATISFPGNTGAALYSIALQPDGKIVAGGYALVNYTYIQGMGLARFETDGSPDLSFGKDGTVITTFPSNIAEIRKVLLQPDGKIVGVGRNYSNYPPQYSDFALIRYKADGTVDSSFGQNGLQTTSISFYTYPTTGILQSDGKTVIVGNDGTRTFYMARYLGDTQQKTQYVRIKHWLRHHGFTWEDVPGNNLSYYSIQRSSNGNIFTEIARRYPNSSSPQQSFQDAANGSYSYRVAAVSTNGNITYSNTLTIADNTAAIKLYPNPAKNTLQIEGLPATAKTKLTVTDLSGTVSITATVNTATYSLNVAQLTKGIYIIKIESGEMAVTRQFIKE